MKHHKRTRTLGRDRKGRTALLKSLAVSLIRDEKITTTEAKAKELRPYIERLVTKAIAKDLSATRLIVSIIGSKIQTKKLVEEIAPKYAKRTGGYTRITKLPIRIKDSAKMALIEFV